MNVPLISEDTDNLFVAGWVLIYKDVPTFFNQLYLTKISHWWHDEAAAKQNEENTNTMEDSRRVSNQVARARLIYSMLIRSKDY